MRRAWLIWLTLIFGCGPIRETIGSNPDGGRLPTCGNGRLDPGEECDPEITDGGLGCSDECPAQGQMRCIPASTTQYETCADHDQDGCLEWGNATHCAASETCASGACQPNPLPAKVLINEVVYDAIGSPDTETFVELQGPAGMSLAGFKLVGVNGDGGADYQELELVGNLGADGYFVIAHPGGSAALQAQADQLDAKVDYQNGPDSLQLRWGTSVVDALGYGAFGATDFFAGETQAVAGSSPGHSLGRNAQHADTDDNLADFADQSLPTPGAINGCGNGQLEPGETCDGNCPSSCEDQLACTSDSLTGSALTCSAECSHQAITQCTPGDGCCPAGCDGTSDIDCATSAWSKRFGDSSEQAPRGVAIDSGGNVIVAGAFFGTVDFGGSPLSGGKLFLAKFDAAGNHLWSKKFYSLSSCSLADVAVDASGNILLAGDFYGSFSLGGGALTSQGGSDASLAKFDPMGNHLWSKRFGDTSHQSANSVAVDGQGNILVAGSFYGSLDLGQGVLTDAGGGDVFLGKFDSSGTALWSKRFGDGAWQRGGQIAVDPSGNVLLTGTFESTISFGGAALGSAGGDDIFLAKLSPIGGHLWSKRFGSSANQQAGTDVAVDGNGAVALVGYLAGSADFGGGVLSSAGSKDIFVARFAADGAHQWSKLFGDASSQAADAVAVDASGNVFVTGASFGWVDFGGGPQPSGTAGDFFLVKLGPAGEHQWSFGTGDASDEALLAVDPAGNPVLAWGFQGTAVLGGNTLAAAGTDILLAKLLGGGP